MKKLLLVIVSVHLFCNFRHFNSFLFLCVLSSCILFSILFILLQCSSLIFLIPWPAPVTATITATIPFSCRVSLIGAWFAVSKQHVQRLGVKQFKNSFSNFILFLSLILTFYSFLSRSSLSPIFLVSFSFSLSWTTIPLPLFSSSQFTAGSSWNLASCRVSLSVKYKMSVTEWVLMRWTWWRGGKEQLLLVSNCCDYVAKFYFVSFLSFAGFLWTVLIWGEGKNMKLNQSERTSNSIGTVRLKYFRAFTRSSRLFNNPNMKVCISFGFRVGSERKNFHENWASERGWQLNCRLLYKKFPHSSLFCSNSQTADRSGSSHVFLLLNCSHYQLITWIWIFEAAYEEFWWWSWWEGLSSRWIRLNCNRYSWVLHPRKGFCSPSSSKISVSHWNVVQKLESNELQNAIKSHLPSSFWKCSHPFSSYLLFLLSQVVHFDLLPSSGKHLSDDYDLYFTSIKGWSKKEKGKNESITWNHLKSCQSLTSFFHSSQTWISPDTRLTQSVFTDLTRDVYTLYDSHRRKKSRREKEARERRAEVRQVKNGSRRKEEDGKFAKERRERSLVQTHTLLRIAALFHSPHLFTSSLLRLSLYLSLSLQHLTWWWWPDRSSFYTSSSSLPSSQFLFFDSDEWSKKL